jgi:hypothetical protein
VGNEPVRPKQQQHHHHEHQHQEQSCGGCSEQSCSNPAQRVTRAEYEAAVAEAQLQLDAAVHAINEALEEVRYAVEELQQG